MALEPGDAIPEDTCEQVGNFPHGILKNPDGLELDPDVFEDEMCVEGKKGDYIDAFDDRDLIVCNEADFAKKGSPFILKLSREDKPDDPTNPKPPGFGWSIRRTVSWVFQERANAYIFCGVDDLMHSTSGLVHFYSSGSLDLINPAYGTINTPGNLCAPEASVQATGSITWDIPDTGGDFPVTGSYAGTTTSQMSFLDYSETKSHVHLFNTLQFIKIDHYHGTYHDADHNHIASVRISAGSSPVFT